MSEFDGFLKQLSTDNPALQALIQDTDAFKRLMNTDDKSSIKALNDLLHVLTEYENKKKFGGHLSGWFEPGTPFGIDKLPKHKAFFDAGNQYRIRAAISGNRCLAEGTLVATPKGPVAIEDIRVGDEVYDRNGDITYVINTFDNGEKEVYDVTSRGKVMLTCTPNHKLDAYVRTDRGKSWRTARVVEQLVRADELSDYNVARRITVKSPLGSVKEPHAYVIGAFLGDGCCTCGSANNIVISSQNAATPEKIASILGTEYVKNGGKNYTYMIRSSSFNHYNEWMRGKRSHEKYVDLDVIKTWDRESLLQFVAGLIDTDGSLSKGKDGHSLSVSMQAYSVVEAFSYACTALWMDSPVISVDGRIERYKNGPVYRAHIRNPWKIKLACDEIRPYLVHKYKAEVDYNVFGGKRSFSDRIKLTMSGKASIARTYDITVAHESHCFLLANGISVKNCGKTVKACFELSCHLTGRYPHWWTGKKFNRPIKAWACGISWGQVKEALQTKIYGLQGNPGTGLIAEDLIVSKSAASGIPGALESLTVKHASGGNSICSFKTYEQGIRAFQGAEVDVVVMDEEPPYDIFDECDVRLMTTGGIMMLTFTPQMGLTPTIVNLYQNADLLEGAEPLPAQVMLLAARQKNDSERVLKEGAYTKKTIGIVQVSMYDVPWLTTEQIEDRKAKSPAHLRDSRIYGRVTVGEGTIYPVALDKITCAPFQIPKHWKRTFGMDVGWEVTACVWGALDPDDDTLYIYSEYVGEEKQPVIHASAIKARGDWIIGNIDYQAEARNAETGKRLIDIYRQNGLRLVHADKAVDAGLMAVLERMTTGRLKIFNTCSNLLSEIPIYRRDKMGKIVKELDHSCFTEATEALTKDGWKSLKDVTFDDEVMAVDANGTGRWETPENVIHKLHTGTVYNINHPHLEFTATDDHSHAVINQMDHKVNKVYRLQKRTVDELYTEMFFPGNFPMWPEGTGAFAQGYDEAYIMGMWLAEGCYRQARPSFIVLDQKKEECLSKIIAALDRLGWTYSKELKKECGVTRIEVSGQADRVTWMKEKLGEYSYGKRLPVSLQSRMTREEREALFEGYMDGDGHWSKNHTHHYDSVSEQLVDDMQVLAASIGLGTRKVSHDCMRAGREATFSDGRTSICRQSWRVHVHKNRPCAHIKKKLFDPVEVENLPVHCVTTSTGFFMARTNGKPFVAGNCDASRYLVMGLHNAKLPPTNVSTSTNSYKEYKF